MTVQVVYVNVCDVELLLARYMRWPPHTSKNERSLLPLVTRATMKTNAPRSPRINACMRAHEVLTSYIFMYGSLQTRPRHSLRRLLSPQCVFARHAGRAAFARAHHVHVALRHTIP